MQKRFLVGAGPSPNTWPRCAEHLEHLTSVRTKPGRVKTSNIFAPTLIQHTNVHSPKAFIYISHKTWVMSWERYPLCMIFRRFRYGDVCSARRCSGRAVVVQPAVIQKDRDGTRWGKTGRKDKCNINDMRIPKQLGDVMIKACSSWIIKRFQIQ